MTQDQLLVVLFGLIVAAALGSIIMLRLWIVEILILRQLEKRCKVYGIDPYIEG
jgi:hypothetical protein